MANLVELEIAGRKLSLETGRMAKQADGAVLVTYGDSSVLVATVSDKEAKKNLGFFPLTIEYRERTYAAGKIPGGFFKREGRPSEKEILTARLIDRPLRPLFPEGYKCETQVFCLIVSSDGENDPDLLGLIGASAALMISDIPWDGPVSCVRIGRIDNTLIVNPTVKQLESSDLDLVVAVRGNDVVMLEGGAGELQESVILEAISLAKDEATAINSLQDSLRELAGKQKREFVPEQKMEGLSEAIDALIIPVIDGIYGKAGKEDISIAMENMKEQAIVDLAGKYEQEPGDPGWISKVSEAIYESKKKEIRKRLAVGKQRIDGRAVDEIRKIVCEVGVLPRAHGSALFTRGETQALAATTLGGERDEQRIDALTGEYTKNFMLHYNFPSFSVGEVRPARGPGRREIGHGALAERAIEAVMPGDDFNYTVRVVADILESNGSSSMATVCGGCLCLMDAGVPIKRPVGGVALGLIKQDDDYVILTDIAGVEDHLGDMDFKVAGSEEGITAIQMDLKVEGISLEILSKAFQDSRKARLHILDKMKETLPESRQELSPLAPRCITVRIPKDKIGKLIGPGGKMIRSIQDETGVEIGIQDDGKVTILSTDADAAAKAVKLVEGIAGEVKVDKLYKGIVRKVLQFGAFVEIMPGTDGLVHISEISHERTDEVSDVLSEGDEVFVKVIAVRSDGKINLSIKQITDEEKETFKS